MMECFGVNLQRLNKYSDLEGLIKQLKYACDNE